MRHAISFVALAALAGPLVGLGGCSDKAPVEASSNQTTASSQNEAEPFDTSFTIKQLMNATVDPAADGLWESVATVSDEKGVVKREPRTAEEWDAVRRHAVTLIEAMNLVMMKGRHAAPAGIVRPSGELSTAQIDGLLASDHETLVSFAQNMQRTTRTALAAIDRRDPVALFEAGSEIDRACEGGHMTFWYPDGGDPRLQHLKK